MPRRRIDTASPDQSVWKPVGQDTFRRNLVALENATNNIPGDAGPNLLDSWLNNRNRDGADDSIRQLPLGVEQQLAEDFAFLAAFEMGTNAVSAAVLEEIHGPDGLVLRLAANSGINQATKAFFEQILNDLRDCAHQVISVQACQNSIFQTVIKFGRKRIRNRLSLRSGQLAEVLERHSPTYPLLLGANHGPQNDFLLGIQDLCVSINRAEAAERRSDAEESAFQEMVTHVHDFCTTNDTRTLQQTILSYGVDYAKIQSYEEICCINKIGRYLGSCKYLAKSSRQYGSLFSRIELACEEPFRFIRSPISSEAPSSTHIEGVECLVHAEIQLVTHYELRNKESRSSKDVSRAIKTPRCIGSSKAACFLCNLFIQEHGQFFLTKTHGRMFDRWTVPDLSSYSKSTRQRYREVLSEMNRKVKDMTEAAEAEPEVYLARKEPLHSWINFQEYSLIYPAESSMLSSSSDSVTSTGGGSIWDSQSIEHLSDTFPEDETQLVLQPLKIRKERYFLTA